MPTRLISYQLCLGINNRKPTEDLQQPTHPYRPGLAPEDLAYEARIADNIDVDNASMPSRRQGTELLTTGVTNVWATADKLQAFCLVAGDLCRLNLDHTTEVLVRECGTAPMIFQEIENLIFFSNGGTAGYIKDRVAYAIPETTEQFRLKLPAGQCMESYRGRLYVGAGKVMWFSDAYRYFRLDGRKNFKQFPDEVDLIAATTDGLYVVSGGITYFLTGDNPHKFELRPVAGYGAFRGTRRLIHGSKVGKGEYQGEIPMWTGAEGICCGLPSGRLLNLSVEKYIMPEGQSAASMVNINVNGAGYSQYITTIK
jgi:hypothetical protein